MSASTGDAVVPVAPLDLRVPGRYHIVGVGGPGMSAIALVLAGMGHRVSGSDLRETPVLERLRAAGVTVWVGHDRTHVEGVDAVTASTAVPSSNLELAAARDLGVTVLPRAGMLASICACARSIAVAGTHGKTTTTSMLAMILTEAGLEPSFVVGGDVNDVGTGAHWSGGDLLVVEADESDGTFLELPLAATILTNVEVDHLDHFGTPEAIVEGFDRYLAHVTGPMVVCADDEAAAALAVRHDAVTYGTDQGAEYRAVDISAQRGAQSFTIEHEGRPLGRVALPLRGVHMVRNATGAIAMAAQYGASFEVARRALARFGGVARRFDFRGEYDGITFVDDYAHLPSEIAAVLEAAATSGDGWRRIVATFQPNRYSRMAVLSPDYRDAFERADVAVITDIYASGEMPRPGVTGKLVVDAVLDAHPWQRVVWMPRWSELVAFLAGELRPGDLCISMGCGDVASLPAEVLARLAERERVRTVIATATLDQVATALGDRARRDVPLGPLTTYRVGGPAAVLFPAASVADLRLVGGVAQATGVPVLVLGRGSNMLVSDRGFRGVVVTLGAVASEIAVDGTIVTVGAAVSLPVLARRTAAAGLTGIEWMVGVPGSVGGAVRMNAGGHGSDVAATLLGVRVIDLASDDDTQMEPSALGLRFRGSDLRDHHVVISARFRLAPGDRQRSEDELAEVVRWRREHQPGGQNCGSVFVNPVPFELSAGQVIDELGLRGLRVGSAQVSEKHANFIQADEGGSAEDVRALMALVRDRVRDERGFALRSEVRLVGFDDEAVGA